MIRILHVIEALSKGGAARSMIATAKYSSRLGGYRHRVVALTYAEDEAIALAEAAGMEVVAAPDAALLRSEVASADILQIHYWNSPEMQRFLRLDLPPTRLALWYHIAGNGSPQIITPELVAMPDLNIPCNPFTYHDLPVFAQLDEEERRTRVAMVYDAADFDRVRHVEPTPHDGFNVGYIGTVDFVKMHPRFVEMSARVDVPGARFVVCGTGHVDLLRAQAREAGASERFDFRGYVDDIASALATFDVYGYPLCEDTYAAAELNLQEAMYAGVPPVVFPYGGVGRLVEHGRTGLVVHSEREYAEAVEHLYHHPEERARLGSAASEYARREFGAENAAGVLNGLYDRLMEGDKRVHGLDNVRDRPSEATAALFVESLGAHGAAYAVSRDSDDLEAVLRADADIGGASLLEFRSGLLPYHRHDPDDAFLLLWIGLYHERQGDVANAVAAFARAFACGLEHPRVVYYLARALRRAGRTQEAERLARQLRESAPTFEESVRRALGGDDGAPPPSGAAADVRLPAPAPGIPSERPATTANDLDRRPGQSSAAGRKTTTPPTRPEREMQRAATSTTSRTEPGAAEGTYRVTVVVPVSGSDANVRGCLEDLVAQTLFRRGALEIVVVDATGHEPVRPTVEEFQARHDHVVYVRISAGETTCRAWNCGVRLARATYLSSARVHDRLRVDALERLADQLDAHPEAALVYADALETDVPHETFATTNATRRTRRPEHDFERLRRECYVGSQPMWRRALHERHGLFDERLERDGDYEFWLRVGETEHFQHYPEVLGLCYTGPGDAGRGVAADRKAVVVAGDGSSLAVAREHRGKLRVMLVETIGERAIANYLERRPELADRPYAERIAALLDHGLGAGGGAVVAAHLPGERYRLMAAIENSRAMQQQWARENGVEAGEGLEMPHTILRAQIEAFRPDVLYVTNPVALDSAFVRSLSDRPGLVVGWHASEIPAGVDWSAYDVILSSLPPMEEAARLLGAGAADALLPAFDPRTAGELDGLRPEVDVVAVGACLPIQHARRRRVLEAVAAAGQEEHGRYSCGFFLEGPLGHLPEDVRRHARPPVYGSDRYRALRRGRIVVDARPEHRMVFEGDVYDLGGPDPVDETVFAATGSGAFLITEHSDAVARYFEPGVEIETYRSPEELVEKIRYYLAHPEEREAIARRGRARCRREYVTAERGRALDAVLTERLRPLSAEAPATPPAGVPGGDGAAVGTGPALPAGGSAEAARARLEEVRQAFARGDFEAALRRVAELKALRLGEKNLDLLRAMSFLKLGRLEDARESLQEELQYHPDNDQARQLLAMLLDRKPQVGRIQDPEFQALLQEIRPNTMVPEARLYSLYRLARRVCEEDLPGNFVECGVARGGSTVMLARLIERYSKRPRRHFAFDSYEGMPEPSVYDVQDGVAADDTGWGTGTCVGTLDHVQGVCDRAGVSELVTLVPGYFEDTLHVWREEVGEIALLHLDADWYTSTQSILENFYDAVVGGGLLQFDDYGCWDGCRRAVDEFQEERGFTLDLQSIPHDRQGVWLQKPARS